MTMKEKIQELCRERDISVRQLERMAGLKERTIQHWDDSDPSGNKLSNIALALKIPIDELFTVYDPSWRRIADVEMQKMSVEEYPTLNTLILHTKMQTKRTRNFPVHFLLFVVAFVVLCSAYAEDSTQERADAENCFWNGIGIRQPPNLAES